MPEHASQSRPKTGRTGKLVGLAAIMFVLGGLWLGGWQWGADRLSNRVDVLLADWSRSGVLVECANRRIEGFPFRVGIFCDAIKGYLTADGSSAQAGSFRSGAQFYAPGKLIAELDGPARLEQPGGVPLILEWDLLRAGATANTNGIAAISLEARDLALKDGWAETAPPMASAISAAVHGRIPRDSNSDLDLAFSGSGLRPAANQIPPFAMSGQLRVFAIAPHLERGFNLAQHIVERGLEGRIETFSLSPDTGGKLQLSGPFSIAQNGQIDAQLSLDADEFGTLMAFIGQAIPNENEVLAIVGNTLRLLAGTGGSLRDIELRIDQGEVLLGPIKLGRIAPII